MENLPEKKSFKHRRMMCLATLALFGVLGVGYCNYEQKQKQKEKFTKAQQLVHEYQQYCLKINRLIDEKDGIDEQTYRYLGFKLNAGLIESHKALQGFSGYEGDEEMSAIPKIRFEELSLQNPDAWNFLTDLTATSD